MNVIEFENKYMQYLMFDDPIPYKGLQIYPTTMKDYLLFNFLSNSLTIDKNNVPDPKIISMSYLDFLMYISKKTDDFNCVANLLSMCLHIPLNQIGYVPNLTKNNVLVVALDKEKNIKLNCSEFDDVKKIICYQNCIEIPEDDEMNPEIKKAIEETLEYKRRHEPPMGSIEHQINYLVANSNLSKKEIGDLSIRSFIDILSIKNYSTYYAAMLNGQYSGMVKFKEQPKSPLCDLRPKDKYADLVTDYNNVKDEINKVS